MAWGYSNWRPYVPVARKRSTAAKRAVALAKKQGRAPAPVILDGRKITTTFWGNAWCKNLESYSDYANRLPRGATYLRNGSVVDLVIQPKRIDALVAGSETYTVAIKIAGLARRTWDQVKQECSASIDSLLDLLAGRFSDAVMRRMTQQEKGLFPAPREIQMECSCPDVSYCCKHLAAVMYGVGARLDQRPELLFVLRGVDQRELVSRAVAEGNLERELGAGPGSLAGDDLGAIFGIELDSVAGVAQPSTTTPKRKPVLPPPTKKVPLRKRGAEKRPPVTPKKKVIKATISKPTPTKPTLKKTTMKKAMVKQAPD